MRKEIENNIVTMVGTVVEEFRFSHELFGEGFYTTNVEVFRKSGISDIIPVIVSGRLVDMTEVWTGIRVKISGNYRSYNKREEGKNRLILTLFAREIEVVDDFTNDENKISIDGYICKQPVFRKTPFGREIADILIAVNRPYEKTDYIPCICWGRNATFASTLEVGTRLKIDGRIQSREYKKRVSDEEFETRTAYEVSASVMEVVL